MPTMMALYYKLNPAPSFGFYGFVLVIYKLFELDIHSYIHLISTLLADGPFLSPFAHNVGPVPVHIFPTDTPPHHFLLYHELDYRSTKEHTPRGTAWGSSLAGANILLVAIQPSTNPGTVFLAAQNTKTHLTLLQSTSLAFSFLDPSRPS
jgi:hypothetical protein